MIAGIQVERRTIKHNYSSPSYLVRDIPTSGYKGSCLVERNQYNTNWR